MHDVMRKRILRKLETLPEAQLYQVLDYIEFLEARHAPAGGETTGFQRFAERLEDRMRARSVAARTMSGTMKVVSTAGKLIDGLSGAVDSVLQAPADRRPAGGSPGGAASGAASDTASGSAQRRLPPAPGSDAREGRAERDPGRRAGDDAPAP